MNAVPVRAPTETLAYSPQVVARTQEHVVRTADGHRLHAEVTGVGPPLLLIQGLGYATWGWEQHVPALAERFRTITFDNRGAGRSDKPDEPYSIELLAEDALVVLDELGSRPAHVVGFSMGGYIALTLARRWPDAVASLVLVATSCGGSEAHGVPEATARAWAEASALPPAEFARRSMPLSYAPGWADAHPDEFERFLTARLRHPTPGFAWRRQLAACEEFLTAGIDVDAVAVPALVVHGTADRVVPYPNAELLVRRLPQAEHLRLEGAGHLALLERPDEVSRAIVEFLSR